MNMYADYEDSEGIICNQKKKKRRGKKNREKVHTTKKVGPQPQALIS